MDKLKEYLLHHRTDLDVDPPASDTWEYMGIRPRSGSARRVMRYAAAACVIALAGVGTWLVIRHDKPPADMVKHTSATIPRGSGAGKEKAENAIQKAPGQDVATPGKDLARNTSTPKRVRRKGRPHQRTGPADAIDAINAIDKSYSTLIDYQLRKLRATPLYAENGSYFSFYVRQFKEMDQDEQQVRNDIKTYGLTSEFLEQLINVYQQKLNVLKSLETEINKMNNKVRERTVPSAKTEVYYLDI
ncbi:MAG TPA: hypothetical protein VGS79_20515 [Puia sp.]|nr:hypothetical protein [Puia sp.]